MKHCKYFFKLILGLLLTFSTPLSYASFQDICLYSPDGQSIQEVHCIIDISSQDKIGGDYYVATLKDNYFVSYKFTPNNPYYLGEAIFETLRYPIEYKAEVFSLTNEFKRSNSLSDKWQCIQNIDMKEMLCKIWEHHRTNSEQSAIKNKMKAVWNEGTYKVGVDIPEGEYKLIEDSNKYGGFYRVYLDSGNKLSSIVTGGAFNNMTYVTVKKGQYLEVSRATFTLVN
ncbi:hypothetical protein EV694_1692 [Volucribacter psittacicida]|uniref:Uncharacterized protein n=2 Tax=Volucribacter psittacicida TaxID=203482 RepID=A0A4R1FXW5_9PAST|nr:hypothetical protein EV694_1692 [Volucribacter psittacicida]